MHPKGSVPGERRIQSFLFDREILFFAFIGDFFISGKEGETLSAERNRDIREYAARKRVFMYELCERLNTPVSTMNYQLRSELPPERKAEIMKTIDQLAAER